jgi:hypothetical protein
MKLCKWVTRNLAVIMRSKNNAFQPHTTLPDGSVGKSSVRADWYCRGHG